MNLVELEITKLSQAIEDKGKTFNRRALERAFAVAFKNIAGVRGHYIFENYCKKLVEKYIPSFDFEAFDRQLKVFEEYLDAGFQKFIQNKSLMQKLKGVNIVYYWEAPDIVDVSILALSTPTVSQADSVLDDYAKLELGDLYKPLSAPFSSVVAEQFLLVSFFARGAKVLERKNLSHVSFSTSISMGAIDAVLPPVEQ